MRVADVSGAGENGQGIGRQANERAGLGLLSRFLGAVFLVLLGGLLLLDRALLRANRNQAQLDAQSAALLTEAFVASQSDLLDRVAGLAAHGGRGQDSVRLRTAAERIVSSLPAVRHIWATDTSGRLVLDVRGPAGSPLPAPLLANLHRLRGTEGMIIAVVRAIDGQRVIWLARTTPTLPGDVYV